MYTNHLSLSGYFNESSEKHLAYWIVWAHSHCIAPIFIATDKAEEVVGSRTQLALYILQNAKNWRCGLEAGRITIWWVVSILEGGSHEFCYNCLMFQATLVDRENIFFHMAWLWVGSKLCSEEAEWRKKYGTPSMNSGQIITDHFPPVGHLKLWLI